MQIGTTVPNYKLDVNGNINTTSYRSNGTDYGEWLEKIYPDESMEEGDVVAVVNGKVTKPGNLGQALSLGKKALDGKENITNIERKADSYMVVTGRAGYVGNEGCPKDRCVVVSFVGQVPVKVAGKAGRGDYNYNS